MGGIQQTTSLALQNLYAISFRAFMIDNFCMDKNMIILL